MIEVIKLEGKTEEELLNQFNLEEVHYQLTEMPAKLFKGKKYEIKVIKQEEVKKFIKNYIENISKAMNININVEIRYKDDCYYIMLLSESNPILIGKEGRTLNAIQLLLHQSLNVATGFNIRINVDASGYKVNREKRLEKQIKIIAKEVLNSKIDSKLDPMNSYDRRIVHSVVNNFKNLKTESFGEEPTRYVVISYKED